MKKLGRRKTIYKKNIEEVAGICKEFKRIKKVIGKRKQEYRKKSGVSLRLRDLKDSKKTTINNVERLKQTLLQTEELKKTIKLKIKELKKSFMNLPKENPFDFTEYLEMRKTLL